MPVCGRDSVTKVETTFGNLCKLRRKAACLGHLIIVLYNGTCEGDDDGANRPPLPDKLAVCAEAPKIVDILKKYDSCNKIGTLRPSGTTYTRQFCEAVQATITCVAEKLVKEDITAKQCASIIKDLLNNNPAILNKTGINNYKPDLCLANLAVCGNELPPLENFNCSVKSCPDKYECKRNYCCPKVKPGVCPKPKGIAVCQEKCKKDDDCDDDEKCCQIGCNTKTCVKSETHIKSNCEKEFENAKKLLQQRGACTDLSSPLRVPRCRNGRYLPTQLYAGTGIKFCVTEDGAKIPGSEHTGNIDCTRVHPGRCPAVNRSQCNVTNTVNKCQDDSTCKLTGEKCCMTTNCIRQCQVAEKDSTPHPVTDCANPVCCPATLCQNQFCPANKEAICQINNCGQCSVEFYVGTEKIDCFEGVSSCERQRAMAIMKNAMMGQTADDDLLGFIQRNEPDNDPGYTGVKENESEDDDEDEGLNIVFESSNPGPNNTDEYGFVSRDINDLPADDDTETPDAATEKMMAQRLCDAVMRYGLCQNGGSCILSMSMEPYNICSCPTNFHGIFCEQPGSAGSACQEVVLRQAALNNALTRVNNETALLNSIYSRLLNSRKILPKFSCDTTGNFMAIQAGQLIPVRGPRDPMIYFCVNTTTGMRIPFTGVTFQNNTLNCSVTTEVEIMSLPRKCFHSSNKSCPDGENCKYFYSNGNRMCVKGPAGPGGFNTLTDCYYTCGRGKTSCSAANGVCPMSSPKPCEDLKCNYTRQYCRISTNDSGQDTAECKDFQSYCLLPPSRGIGEKRFGGYYFNATNGKCMKAIFSEIGGNKNRFYTLHQCHTECAPKDYRFDDVTCPAPRFVPQDDLMTNQCDNDFECNETQVCCSNDRARRCVDKILSCQSGLRCSVEGACSDELGHCVCPQCEGEAESKVCGSDGRTYSNQCMLRQAACKYIKTITVVSQGECASVPTNDGFCDFTCNISSPEPVCALEVIVNSSYSYVQRTYESKCKLKEEKCKNDNIYLRYNGPCRDGTCGITTCHPYEQCDLTQNKCVCPTTCTREYQPVCGRPYDNPSVMETFSNLCEMELKACNTSSLYVVLKLHPCETKPVDYVCPTFDESETAGFTEVQCKVNTTMYCPREQRCCQFGKGSKCIDLTAMTRPTTVKPGQCPTVTSADYDRSRCTVAACTNDTQCSGEAKCCYNDACNGPTCVQPIATNVCGSTARPLPDLTCDPTANPSQCPTGSTCTAVSTARLDVGVITRGVCCMSAGTVDSDAAMAFRVCSAFRDAGLACQNGQCIGNLKTMKICNCSAGYYGLLCDKQSTVPTTTCTANTVNCLVDPCTVNKCPAIPDAICTANYCGGCNAVFTKNGKNVTGECQDSKCTRTTDLYQRIASVVNGMPKTSSDDDTAEENDDREFSRTKRQTPTLISEDPDDDSNEDMEDMDDMDDMMKQWSSIDVNVQNLKDFLANSSNRNMLLLDQDPCETMGNFKEEQCFMDSMSERQFCTCVDMAGNINPMAPRTRTRAELDCSVLHQEMPSFCFQMPPMNNTLNAVDATRYFYNPRAGQCQMYSGGSLDARVQNSFPDLETCQSVCEPKVHTMTQCAVVRCTTGTTCVIKGGNAICIGSGRNRTPTSVPTAFEPMCEKDGRFALKQCQDTMCACVNQTTGAILDGPFTNVPDLDCNKPSTFPSATAEHTCDSAGTRKPGFCEDAGADPCSGSCDALNPESQSNKTQPTKPSKTETCQECKGITCKQDKVCNLECGTAVCKTFPSAICKVNRCNCEREFLSGDKLVDCNKVNSQCEIQKAEYDAENRNSALNNANGKAAGGKSSQKELKCKEGSYYALCEVSGCYCLNSTTGAVVGEMIKGSKASNINCDVTQRKTKPKMFKVKTTLAKDKSLIDLTAAERSKYEKIAEKLTEAMNRRLTQGKATKTELQDGSIVGVTTVEETETTVSSDVDLNSEVTTLTQQIRDGEVSFTVDGQTITPTESVITEAIVLEEDVDDDDDSGGSNGKKIAIGVGVGVGVLVVLFILTAIYCYKGSKRNSKRKDIPFSDIHGKVNPTYES